MIKNLSKIVINNGGDITPLIIPSDLTDGTGLCNVSIFIDDNGDILANIRHVHYTLYHSEFNQKFYCKWGALAYLNPEDDVVLKTGNYLCKLDPKTLEVLTHQKIDTSTFDVDPVWTFVGLEDARVMKWDDTLYICGVRRDIKPDGEGRMELCEIDWDANKCNEISRDRIAPPSGHTYLEKNWAAIIDMPYHFVRWANPLEVVKINPDECSSEVVVSKDDKIDLPRGLRGSSQVIPVGDEGDRITITHEVDFFHHPGMHKDAFYYHRFIVWDKDWNLKRLSAPFSFMDTRIEFNTGLAIQGDDFLITYGYQDNAAYALRMPIKLLDELEWEDLPKLNKPIVRWHEPIVYTKSDYSTFKLKFDGLENIEKNYSQVLQDLFVLYALKGKREGFYIEVGGGKPYYGNNTALLKEFGWEGITFEIDQSLINQWKTERPSDKIFSTDATTIDWVSFLEENKYPTTIDYLQLDIDPASNTYKVLENIDFDKLKFNSITYEHDAYDGGEVYRKKSRKILQKAGYVLVAGNISPSDDAPFEDWWVHEDYSKGLIKDIDKDVLYARDYAISSLPTPPPPKYLFTTFGDDKLFKNRKKILKKQAEETGWFNDISIETPKTIKDLLEPHKDFITNNPRGYGYWIWKPMIIKNHFNQMNDNDIVFYIDCGSSIISKDASRYQKYLSILDEYDVIVFQNGEKDFNHFVKMNVINEFDLLNTDIIKMPIVEGGFVIAKNTSFSMRFMDEWEGLLTKDNYGLVNDDLFNLNQLDTFIEHRHDQSLLTIIARKYKNKVKILEGMEELYHIGPFYHSRLTDKGPRKWAKPIPININNK